jgi:predicted ester cyclase
MHPFVALMRRYCIDYTNTHDQSVCDAIMEPDYVVHIGGFDLPRDLLYKPAVADLFERAPGLGLVVHDFVLNGDRLCMRFSEHASMPAGGGRGLACWRGIGLYQWNGTRLTENWVEQDHLAMHQQLVEGVPHELEPPHLDPWVGTEPVPPNEGAEAITRAWLEAGDLAAASWVQLDDTPPGSAWAPSVDTSSVRVDDLFSAGSRVPFHITVTGPYTGAIPGVPADHVGAEVTLPVSGIAEVRDGRVEAVRAVTSRVAVRYQLTGASPI